MIFMSGIIYQVIFRGKSKTDQSQTILTFKNVLSEKYIHIPTKYITTLKNLSEKTDTIINFQNIDEIVVIGSNETSLIYNYYIVLLLIHKEDMRKEGYLIGNAKKVGDILIGIWPFTEDEKFFDANKYLERLDNIISNPTNFEKIALIYS